MDSGWLDWRKFSAGISSSLEDENPDLCPVWPAGQVSIHPVKYHRRHLLLPLSSPLMTSTDQTLTLDPDFNPSKWRFLKYVKRQNSTFINSPSLSHGTMSCAFPPRAEQGLLWQTAAERPLFSRCKLKINAEWVFGTDVKAWAIETYSVPS